MDIDPDELSRLDLDREEVTTALILAVGLWIAAVEVLNVGPLVASGFVAAFATFAVFSLLDGEFE